MHDTALKIGQAFLAKLGKDGPLRVIEIGSLDVNGSLREFSRPSDHYVGIDLGPGRSVDVVAPQGRFPFGEGIADVVVASSVFEHDSSFWITFVEGLRLLKPGGVFYMSAPSNGHYHAYPVDNWRFYPDSGLALAQWATSQGVLTTLIESFIAARMADVWNDFVAIFQREGGDPYPKSRLLYPEFSYSNVRSCFEPEMLRPQEKSEDQTLIVELSGRIGTLQAQLAGALSDRAGYIYDLALSQPNSTEPALFAIDDFAWSGDQIRVNGWSAFNPTNGRAILAKFPDGLRRLDLHGVYRSDLVGHWGERAAGWGFGSILSDERLTKQNSLELFVVRGP